MTGFAATHTGSLTPSSDPWTFVGTVTWQSDIDPAILPDNEPVVLRLAFTTLSLTGATIAFTSSGSGRAATLPANGPFDGSTDYTVASHKNRTVTYTITGVGPVGSGALAMAARSENYDLFTAGGTFVAPSSSVRFDLAGQKGQNGTGGGTITGGAGGRVVGTLDLSGSATVSMSGAGSRGTSYDPSYVYDNHGGDGGNATIVADGATTLLVAGGGGGGGRDSYRGTARGGAGGGLVGAAGEGWYSGGGGTQSAGGAAGGSGTAGASLQGGDGGDGLTPWRVGGAGGGGGYYGGGGGGGELTLDANQLGAAGGGGSSYTDPSATDVVHTQGGSLGTAYALFAWGFVDLFAGDAIPPAASGWHIGSLRFGSTGPGW